VNHVTVSFHYLISAIQGVLSYLMQYGSDALALGAYAPFILKCIFGTF
jgi:hypothetical protein